ncbi:MAG TPA: hypothetical protein VHA33_26790 [Candidatus Angelobacter sp.]|jgi:hypothetical protein|nr:hypothetical protein [Candidatus Angelobacter sp.]
MNPSGTRALHSVLRTADSHVSYEDSGTYHSGEIVLVSGIYKAGHSVSHGKHSGEVVAIKGGQFPNCSCCGASLKFALLQSAMHISEDEDFGNWVNG